MVSETFGAMLGVYCWITVNALLVKLYEMKSGHLIVILIGIPIVVIVMKRLRANRIEWLMSSSLDKFTKDIECLNQIMSLQEWMQELQKTNSSVYIEIKLKGFINEHF